MLLFFFSFCVFSCDSDGNWGGQEKQYDLLTADEVSTLDVNTITSETLCKLGLPVMDIVTVNGEIPTYEIAEKPYDYCMGQGITNATKVPGRFTMLEKGKVIYDSGEYVEGESGMTIRVRGNTSCTLFEKKPYKIKLQKSADLLFREQSEVFKDKDWLFLKDDNLYSMLGLKVNSMIGLDWTPAYRYVNVMLNGEYKGLYMLIESVEREPKIRINVAKDGYLFEYDAYWWNEPYSVKSKVAHRPMRYTLKYPKPEDMDDTAKSAFEQMLLSFETSVIEGDYDEVLDTQSFVNWMIGHDILGGWDGDGSNYYITKYDSSASSKIKMTTMWDFDAILSTKDQWDGSHDKFVYDYLFKDKFFVSQYVKRYDEIHRDLFDNVRSWLQEIPNSEGGKALALSMILNHKRWAKSFEDLNTALVSFDEWMATREIWMNDKCEELRLY